MTIGIVVNKKARNAHMLTSYLDALAAHDIPYIVYEEEPEHLEQRLKEVKEQHELLLIGGGDGTVRSAAQHCLHSKTILGVLPLGTLNHFSQELALPATPDDLVQAIKGNSTTVIDVAEVNGIIFVNNSSIGFYPHFAKKRNYYTKFYNKWISYIPGFLQALRSHPTFNLTVKSEHRSYPISTSFLMISNNLYSYEFPLTFARVGFSQSQLGVYFFKHGKLKLSKLIRYFFKRKKSFEIKTLEVPIELHIEGINEVNVSLDGEVLSLKTPLCYRSLPRALTVLAGVS